MRRETRRREFEKQFLREEQRRRAKRKRDSSPRLLPAIGDGGGRRQTGRYESPSHGELGMSGRYFFRSE